MGINNKLRDAGRSVTVNTTVATKRLARPATSRIGAMVNDQRAKHREEVTAKMAELHERDVERAREQEAEEVFDISSTELDYNEALGKIIKAVTKR